MLLRVLLILFFATTARADLQLTLAHYGNSSRYRDVRGEVTALLRNNTLSFPVNARSMGGDPTPGAPDFLYIEYRAGGLDYTDTVKQGGIFTVRGVPNVTPVKGVLFFPPATPRPAPTLIINQSGATARVYSLDRFGQWVWFAEMNKGLTLALHAQVGQEWIALDRSNRVLTRAHISRGENTMRINQP